MNDLEVSISDVLQNMFYNRDRGNYEAALVFSDLIIKVFNDNAMAFVEHGRLLRNIKEYDRAIESFRKALSINNDVVIAHLLLGHTILDQKNLGGYRTTAFCDNMGYNEFIVDDAVISELYNLGMDLWEAGYLDEAIEIFTIVIRFRRGLVHAYYALSSLYMSRGCFERAAPLIKIWNLLTAKINYCNVELWSGEDLYGKTLYIYYDHGLGDIIQFVRFVPAIAAKCKRVYFCLPESLRVIIGHIENVEFVSEAAEGFDYACSLFILPHVMGIELSALPGTVPYLQVEPRRVEFWRRRLPDRGFRIGIAWQGNPESLLDPGRSIPLACYAPLARLPGVELISLQMHHGLDQLEHLPDGMTVTTLGPDFNAGPDNVVDTAAVMRNLDLIISSDTSVPHIAGALGCPVWVVLRAVPDWRWLLEREDCPWYPTMRLFRQKVAGDWSEPVRRMAEEIARLPAFGLKTIAVNGGPE